MSRYLGPALALAVTAAALAGPAAAETTVSPDARCFLANVFLSDSEKKEKDRKLYDNTAMFFLGRLAAHGETVPDVDIEKLVTGMSEDEFVADVRRCMDELEVALDTVTGKTKQTD